jgi:hypothetical protein
MKMRGQILAPPALITVKSPWYLFNRKLDGFQSRSARYGEQKISAYTGNKTLVEQPVSTRSTDRAVTLSTCCHLLPQCSEKTIQNMLGTNVLNHGSGNSHRGIGVINSLDVVLLGFSAMMMETVCFSETLVSTYESTRRQNSEKRHHPHRLENLKSHINSVACANKQCRYYNAWSPKLIHWKLKNVPPQHLMFNPLKPSDNYM